MKKILAVLMLLCLLAALTACRSDDSLYIEPAQLSEEEEAVAELLGLNTKHRIYDFVLDDTVQSMELSVYQLQDGAWEPISNGGRAFADKEGRLAIGFDNIAEGFRLAVQSDSHGGADSFTPGEEFDFTGMSMATSTLSDRTEIVYDREIPLAVQIITAQNELQSYMVDYFHIPEEYAKHDYEHVYAVTVRFSQKTVTEIESAN